MPLDGEIELVGGHASAVIGYRDQGPAAVAQYDLDVARAGVNSVFDQFLDGGGRALDDFAGGDAVDHDRRQLADFHWFILCDRGFTGDEHRRTPDADAASPGTDRAAQSDPARHRLYGRLDGDVRRGQRDHQMGASDLPDRRGRVFPLAFRVS